MPIYTYKCSSCETIFDKAVVRAKYARPQLCECGASSPRVVGQVDFVLKGDGWIGKNQKIRGQMAEKNQRLSVKSRERRHDAPGMRLVPNVKGERVESWEDAAKLAQSKGLNSESYAIKARQEKTS